MASCTVNVTSSLLFQGEPGSGGPGGGLPGRKGEPGIPGIPVRNKAEGCHWTFDNFHHKMVSSWSRWSHNPSLIQTNSSYFHLWNDAGWVYLCCSRCLQTFNALNVDYVMFVSRVLQVVLALMGLKVPLEFQGHQVRMVAQVYQEHQDSPSRFVHPCASPQISQCVKTFEWNDEPVNHTQNKIVFYVSMQLCQMM